jgi:hypothetical protein
MTILAISLTNQCNRSCAYCPVAKWRNNPDYPDKLTLESTIAVIDKLKPTHVEITGGEPTLVPWLDELCNYLDSQKIVYLVKSNGFKRCKNQVTAWHDGLEKPPENYDQILIIMGTEDWSEKAGYCRQNNIPFQIIGYNNTLTTPGMAFNMQQLFLCPDGKIKQCHERELQGEPEWKPVCWRCKAVEDFVIFLERGAKCQQSTM